MTRAADGGLAERLRAVLGRSPVPGRVHLAAWSADNAADGVFIDADRPVVAASTIKVPILAAALLDVAAGRVALNDRVALPSHRVGGSGVLQALDGLRDMSLADLLTLMIVVSDNVATNAVIDLIGMPRINDFCRREGLAATALRRLMMDLDARARGEENTTSARDQATLLAALVCGDLLDAPLRDVAVRALVQQQFNDGLPALLPDDVVVAHKTGELPGLRHDVGVLMLPNGRRTVIAVLVSGLTGSGASRAAIELIAAVGEAASVRSSGHS